MPSATAATRRFGRAIGLAAALSLLTIGVATAAPAGNNGTVKIHAGSSDNGPALRNDAQVCTFHLHFFFADPAQAGAWHIDEQAPTGSATILTGTYAADANGEYQSVEMGLPIGHYQLSWDGRDPQNEKSKTFQVTCDFPPGPIGGGIG
jgi:hypothetical protein